MTNFNFINTLLNSARVLLSATVLLNIFTSSTVLANQYPNQPIYYVSNNQLAINAGQSKSITPSDLKVETNGVKAMYSNSNYTTFNGLNRIYITLDNGTNVYPPSTICIDGQKFNESTSGSGMFVVEPTIAPNSGLHYLYIPDFFGDCTFWSPNQGYSTFSFLPNESLNVAIKTSLLTDSDIYFEVTSMPTMASLKINGKTLVASDLKTAKAIFTQKDINDGKVILSANNNGNGVGSFKFTATDLYYYNDSAFVYGINLPEKPNVGGTTLNPGFSSTNTTSATQTTASSSSSTTTNQTSNFGQTSDQASTQVSGQTTATQPNSLSKIATVLGASEKVSDQYMYGIKGLSQSANKPLTLSANLKMSKISGARNSKFTMTLTNIVRVDPELKNLTCELVSLSNDSKTLATGSVDKNGKCVISWTPGTQTPKGRFSGYIKITDPKRGHIYTTNRFNLNLR